MTKNDSVSPSRRFVLHEIDPKRLGIEKTLLTNVPLINHLQECAEIEQLIYDERFCQVCIRNRINEPIVALNFEWYGRTLDLLTLLLQRAILGTESFISGVVLQEVVVRSLVTPKTKDFVRNPFVLGGKGTADSFYNKLPAQIDEKYSLKKSHPNLWHEVSNFYKEIRNPLFHGYLLNTNDPATIRPYISLIKQIFYWINNWYTPLHSTMLPIKITKYWPVAENDQFLNLNTTER